MAGGEEGATLEYTPTWVVALVCSVIVIISLAVERILHYVGKGKVPLLSQTALHHLHIFIFVLAVVHVVFCVLTILFGGFKTHCRGNPKFNFHKYMIRALEADFKKVVGIRLMSPFINCSWYLWLFVVIFLLLNVAGWHAYFWIAFIPFILLLAVGTKLEHVISQLAHEVAEKHVAIQGALVVQPSDDHFWFHRPKLVLLLIHIILFQNSFELAFFFWIWVQYGFDSCIMGKIAYIIPRLVIGVFVQFVCSYSTLPLYAIVTQMGTSFKKAIFEEHIQEGLVGWARAAKKGGKGLRKAANGSTAHGSTAHGSTAPGSSAHDS
ncbi:MLO-like protein 1 [Morella rubra]|uniref:MLO-like protein 1 n=1 Tax=Morella rubra TaxID=262757 RepID=A0A6A1W604_9ROSI|nr:MLO-like protein 1 [Morella rubra]